MENGINPLVYDILGITKTKRKRNAMITFYTNLLPIIDECNDYIPTKEGRYSIVQVRNNMIHLMNVNNGAQGVVRKDYFEKEYEPCEIRKDYFEKEFEPYK